MAIPISDFWKLVAESRLLTAAECEKLDHEFGSVKGAAAQGNSRTLAEWLISRKVMSRYQTTVILGGRAGPFIYGSYKIYDRENQGPLSGMFRALHITTGHPVLLRFLTGTNVQNPQTWKTLATQAEPYYTLVDPHLVRCFETVDLEAYKFLVMEGLTGKSLSDTLAEAGGRFALPQAARIARQITLGLARLHQIDRVAADIRPETIWVEPSGNIKLLHNPFATVGPIHWQAPDPTGLLLAQADYAAPELMQPGTAPNPLSDIYSLGCLFYRMVVGQPPFPAGDIRSKMNRHATEPIQPLHHIASIPEAVGQITLYLMAKNPSVRYQKASDVADALQPSVDPSQIAPQPSQAAPTLPAYERTIHEQRAKRALAMSQQPKKPA